MARTKQSAKKLIRFLEESGHMENMIEQLKKELIRLGRDDFYNLRLITDFSVVNDAWQVWIVVSTLDNQTLSCARRISMEVLDSYEYPETD